MSFLKKLDFIILEKCFQKPYEFLLQRYGLRIGTYRHIYIVAFNTKLVFMSLFDPAATNIEKIVCYVVSGILFLTFWPQIKQNQIDNHLQMNDKINAINARSILIAAHGTIARFVIFLILLSLSLMSFLKLDLFKIFWEVYWIIGGVGHFYTQGVYIPPGMKQREPENTKLIIEGA